MNKSLIRQVKKRELVSPNITLLAKKIKKSRTWVSLVWNRRAKSKKTQELIAEALGIPYDELWGDN